MAGTILPSVTPDPTGPEASHVTTGVGDPCTS